MLNRLSNCHNHYQGSYKHVLCVCSAGLLRSPTVAFVLSKKPFSFNTRAVGYNEEYALMHIDRVLLVWADEIVVMDEHQKSYVENLCKEFSIAGKSIINLDIPDIYGYRDPKLIKIIKKKYKFLKTSP